MKRNRTVLLATVLAFACAGNYAEEIDVADLLPEGSSTEIINAYPEFTASLVSDSETGVPFNDKYVVIEGVEDEEARDRLARYVVSYLENPTKKADEARRRAEYDALAPQEKMDAFVERVRTRSPEFSYEWTGADGGNVEVVYGDNSLMIHGVESDGAREEIAHGIIRIQKEIDAGTTGESEDGGEAHEEGGEEHEEGGEEHR